MTITTKYFLNYPKSFLLLPSPDSLSTKINNLQLELIYTHFYSYKYLTNALFCITLRCTRYGSRRLQWSATAAESNRRDLIYQTLFMEKGEDPDIVKPGTDIVKKA